MSHSSDRFTPRQRAPGASFWGSCSAVRNFWRYSRFASCLLLAYFLVWTIWVNSSSVGSRWMELVTRQTNIRRRDVDRRHHGSTSDSIVTNDAELHCGADSRPAGQSDRRDAIILMCLSASRQKQKHELYRRPNPSTLYQRRNPPYYLFIYRDIQQQQ